jgi:Zn finger protein HypA/HybF involved in hydrogenase expression
MTAHGAIQAAQRLPILWRMARLFHDWQAVQLYYDAGHGYSECRDRFGFSRSAWNKAIARGRLRPELALIEDRRRRYDWAAVQAYYAAGHSYRECRTRFGFSAAAWTSAVKRGRLKARARASSIEAMFAAKMARGAIKRRLLEMGVMEARCSRCGLYDWRGKPLIIHLDHVNGIRDDWRLENLRMLCPNCHSQTPTFSGRNRRRRVMEESD